MGLVLESMVADAACALPSELMLAGVVGVCHLSLSHGGYLGQIIIGGEMCCFLLCARKHYMWI